MHIGLPPKAEQKWQIEISWLAFLPPLCICQAQAEQMLQPYLLHVTVQHSIWGCHNWGEKLNYGTQRQQVTGWSPDGAAMAIVGNYSSSASEATQISDSGCSTTAHTPHMQRVHVGLTFPAV